MSEKPNFNTMYQYFDTLRHDTNHYLGLGDIRLTVGQQEEIEAMFAALEEQLAEKDRLLVIAADYLSQHWDMDSEPLRQIAIAGEREEDSK